jgi:phage terminase large subunit-like protein
MVKKSNKAARPKLARRAPGIAERMQALEKLLKDGRPRATLEMQAIQRQLRDLDEGHKRGLIWREEAVQRSVRFFSCLQHWKGRQWAGKPFELMPWQEHCIIAPLFGWHREFPDGILRRFRVGYIEVPRKNGKTTLAAGIALQGLVYDDEPGSEVYAGAKTKDQASILFRDVLNCRGPKLKEITKERTKSLEFPRTQSFFRPLPAKGESLDGLNAHRNVVDELHAHASRELWDVLLGATGNRLQPLTLAITTAGVDRTLICWEIRELARGVLEGEPDHDDEMFGYIACAEENDDWQDPQTWAKANPNLGVSVTLEFLAGQAKRAKASGSAESNFRRKHLNQWVSAYSRWVDPLVWDKGQTKNLEAFYASLMEQDAWVGFDQGGRDDFAAAGLVFPERVQLDTGPIDMEAAEVQQAIMAVSRCKIRRAKVLLQCWIAENGRRDITKAPLCNWIRDGWVRVTPGKSTDHDAILAWLEEQRQKYRLKELAYDDNNARQFGIDVMNAGMPAFAFYQTKRNYNEPAIQFEALVADGLIEHDGNPLLRWMIGNVVMEADARGYIQPAKHKSADKIDGVVALLMGYARALFTDLDQGSVYERRGMLVL